MLRQKFYQFITFVIFFNAVSTTDYHQRNALQEVTNGRNSNRKLEYGHFFKLLKSLLNDPNKKTKPVEGLMKKYLNFRINDNTNLDSANEHYHDSTNAHVFIIKHNDNPPQRDSLSNKHSDTDYKDHRLKSIARNKNKYESESDGRSDEFPILNTTRPFPDDDDDSSGPLSSGEIISNSTGNNGNTENKGISRSCYKKWSKCKKACYASYRSVCTSYACSGGMRSKFKYKCKDYCSYYMYDDYYYY